MARDTHRGDSRRAGPAGAKDKGKLFERGKGTGEEKAVRPAQRAQDKNPRPPGQR